MISCSFEGKFTALLRHVVVHAIVEKDGAILLGKRTGDILETGKWGLPAGYLDRDETLEHGVLRELKEETGWDGEVVGLLRVNSRPDRPHEDRQNIAFDYIVRPLAKTGEPDKENSKLEWIPIERLLPLDQFAFDHGESIQLYLDWKRERFPIPIIG